MAGDTLPETDPTLRQTGALKGWKYYINSHTLRGKLNIMISVFSFWSMVVMYRRSTAEGRALKKAEKRKIFEAQEEERLKKMYAKY